MVYETQEDVTMQKFLNKIKRFRAGNRILVETEYARTLSLRRRNEEEAICTVECKDKDACLLLDILAVIGIAWAMGRVFRLIGRLFR